MHPRRTLPLALLSALLAAAAVLGACSKDKGTNPITTTNTETFNASMNAVGTSFEHTFTNPSTGYCYHCTIHSSGCGDRMWATVVVDAAAAQDSAIVNVGFGGGNVFNPTSVTIKPGGYVRWVNASGSHTVTRP